MDVRYLEDGMLHHQHKILILLTVYRPGAGMMMSGRKTLAETWKVEELKSQQEAEGVQVVSLTWTKLKYLAMATSFSVTLCGCCDVAGKTTHVGSSAGRYHLTCPNLRGQ